MNAVSRLILTFALAAAPAMSQTTGVPLTNDYTINGLGSGTTSATPLTVSSGFVNFEVSTQPGIPVFYLFSFCPAVPGFVGLPPQTACLPPMPYTAISGTTNQSIDLDVGCPMIVITGQTGSDGVASFNVSLPPGFMSTQAVSMHPCATGIFPMLMTQAFDLTVV